MIISNLSLLVCTLIDGLMVSVFLSSESMAAYGLVSSMLNLFIMVSFLFTSGLKNICSKLVGAGNLQKAKEIYSVALLFLTLISVLISVGLAFFNSGVAGLLGADRQMGNLRDLVEKYILGLAPGLPFMCLQFAFSFVLYFDGKGKYATIAVIFQTAVDIIGDFLCIFVFKGGLLGIGLATSASNIVAALLSVIFIVTKTHGLRFCFRGIHLKDIVLIVKGGIPSAAERLYTAIRSILLNRILLMISVEAVTAFAVLSSLTPFYLTESLSVGMTVLPMASVYYGERDKTSLKELLRCSSSFGFLTQIVMTLVIIVTASPLVGLFCQSGSTVFNLAVTSVYLYAAALPLNIINSIYLNYLHALGYIVKTSLLSFFNNDLFRLSCAYFFGVWFGHTGIWCSYFASELVTFLIIFAFTSFREKHLAVHISDYLYIPKDCEMNDECFEMSAKHIDEVVVISRKAAEYLDRYDLTSKQKNLVALTIEEIGRNICQWGFNDKKTHILDVRLTKSVEGFIIRIRDDSSVIDPLKWVQIHHPEDEVANIGFRIVSKTAKEIIYSSSLGINNLIIKL